MPIVAQGALGTINGPLNANAPEDKLGNGVSWIWNLENAKKIMLRDLAGALPTGASLSVLNSIGAGDYAGRLGWCGTNGTNGKMIPINADGKPTYGQDSTLGCPPGQLYTSAASVPAASSSQNAVQASQAASIQPLLDCATAGNSVSLTRDCFLQAIKNSQCGAAGTLYQSLQLANGADSRWDSYLNTQPSFQAYQSRQGANGITDSLFQKNQGKWETALADIARTLKLGEYIRLGKGEEVTGGRDKNSLLADALEALIGAIYLETGIEKTTKIVTDLIHDTLESALARGAGLDGKTALQELVAAQGKGAPEYVVTESGPDHDKSFVAVAMVAGQALAQGEGKSKREAEQFAARNAFDILSVTQCSDSTCSISVSLGTFSGRQLPPPLTSKTGIIKVTFASDTIVVDIGFYATFLSVCPA